MELTQEGFGKMFCLAGIGGLTLCVFVALFLLPCIYLVFTRKETTSE